LHSRIWCATRGPDGRDLSDLLSDVIAGGVDVVQLREKHVPDDELVGIARAAHALCERSNALLVVNDRPAVAVAARAGGVHVGQDDMAPAHVREIAGPDMLIGLSTYAPAEINAVDPTVVDYVGVGPVHETPIKPGRPAVGLELVRYAAARAGAVLCDRRPRREQRARGADAGATRVCVLRAIASAEEPRRAARTLQKMLHQ
jgi:thiamine-phosphate pyrophosphorylase